MSGTKTMKQLAGLLPIVLLSLFFCFRVHAAEDAKTDTAVPDLSANIVKSDSPINVTADRMEAKQDERTIVFEGHVVVVQDDLTITSNRLKVTVLPEEKEPAKDKQPAKEKRNSRGKKPASAGPSPKEKIDYIEFEGDVKVTQQDKLATAQKAIFYQREQKIVMHGRPVVTQGQDRVEGDLITIYLEQNRSVVESGNGAPVKALLFPGKEE